MIKLCFKFSKLTIIDTKEECEKLMSNISQYSEKQEKNKLLQKRHRDVSEERDNEESENGNGNLFINSRFLLFSFLKILATN